MKSFILPLIEPLGAIWTLMFIYTCWAAYKRQWKVTVSLGVFTALFFVVGSTPIAETLVRNEEARWESESAANYLLHPRSGVAPQPVDVVLVLGGGYYPAKFEAFGFTLTGASARIATGIELARTLSPKSLVLGGSVPDPDRPEHVAALTLQEWVQRSQGLGMTVTNLGICADTHDEAVRFSTMRASCGWSNVVLVTSALHMRRSRALFDKQQIPVAPCACDFQIHGGFRADLTGFSVFPRQARFGLLHMYLHEKIGWSLYKLRGWI